MTRPIDRRLRRELLDELRRRQTREQAGLTPAVRLEQAEELASLAHGVPVGADEPPELWLRLLAARPGRRHR